MKKIRILLADDHAVLRAGLRALIEAQPDMRVVAEAGDGAETIRQAQETHPDVAVVDMGLDGRIAGWNMAAHRMFGWSPADAIGRPIEEAYA